MTYNELKNGQIIQVQTDSINGVNNPQGWWGAHIHTGTELKNIHAKVLQKIVKLGQFKVVGGGYQDGKLVSTVTHLEIVK